MGGLRREGLLNWMGGKSKIADWICSYIDYSRLVYLELFLGGGSVLWAKDRHRYEVVNDGDGELVNFYRVVKDCSLIKRMVTIVRDWLWSDEVFNEVVKMDISKLDEVERAARFYYLNQLSVNGFGGSYAYRWNVEGIRDFFDIGNLEELFTWYNERLRGVFIYNKDFREVLGYFLDRNKDLSNFCVYADPPYWGVNYYAVKFSEGCHKDLAELLNKIVDKGGYVLVSYYDFEGMRELYPGDKWLVERYGIAKISEVRVKQTSRSVAEEVLLVSRNNLFI